MGEVDPDEEEESDLFERPDEDALIGKKTKKKRQGRYPERTGLAIYDNVTGVFDDTRPGGPGVTDSSNPEPPAY